MKTSPRLFCAVSLVAATVCFGRIADAREAEDVLAALRRHLDDDRAFLEVTARVAASGEEDSAVREAALRSVVCVAAETGDWLDMERLCRSLLASRRTPERLLHVCVDGLALSLRMLVGYRHATEELEEFARDLTGRARPAVATALDVMRRPVRSELDSRVAHRLPAPLVTRSSELTAEVASGFPGAVETSVELTAEVASGFPGAVETSVELTAEVASRFPGPVETSVELTAEVASRFPGAIETSVELTAEVASGFPGAVETSVELTAEVASGFPGAVETSVELTAEVASRFPGPVETSVDKSRADRMLGWAEQTLSAYLLQEARALEEAKDLEGARARYADVLTCFPSGGEAVTAFEGLSRTLASGKRGRGPAGEAQRLKAWVREHARSGETMEAAEYLVCQTLYRERSFKAALAAISEFRERYPESRRLPQLEVLEGLVRVNTGETKKALAIFERLSEDEGCGTEVRQKALFLAGWTHLFNQDIAEAREALEAVVRKYPKSEYARKARELLKGLPAGE